MKKNFIFALMSAIALTGVTGLTACSDKEELAEVNPGYNAETGEVPVDFVFNVSTSNTPTTRMTSANTQATISEKFRGIEDVQLMAFKLSSGDGKTVAVASTTTTGADPVTTYTTADKYFTLGTIMGAESIDPDNTGGTVPKSRRVIELALPTGANTLMFWGKAIKEEADNKQGKITWNVNKKISDNEFRLVRIVEDDTADGATKLEKGRTAFLQYESLIAAILTNIIQTSVTYTAVEDPQDATNTTTGTLAWKDFVEEGTTEPGTYHLKLKANDPVTTTNEMSSLGEILGKAFVTLNTIYTDELRAGSAVAVARMIGDLYTAINKVANATPNTLDEAVAKEVAKGIVGNIEKAFKDCDSNCQFKDIKSSTDKTAILGLAGLSADDIAKVTEDLNGFPMNFNLPGGATILNFNKDTDGKYIYHYKDAVPTYAMGGTTPGATNTFDPQNYMYPAELCYFGNSPIRVTDDTHATADYPDGPSNWVNEASWAAGATGSGSKAWTKDGHVLSSTRSVAMRDNINYGTALLKTTVRYKTNILEDNNHNIQSARSGANEENNKFYVTNPGLFTLTGVLIGGQESVMGWNYVAKSTDPKFAAMVYDRDLPSTAIPAATIEEGATTGQGVASTPCYTLVWDNWDVNNAGGDQRIVYIALEFTNNTGKDFWGQNNLIRNGGVFYIVGQLNPNKDANGDAYSNRYEGITWPTNYALPPYNEDGSTKQERRVFIQDYMTTANFALDATSLQHALVAVPDLRSAQMSLGLSVDLTWSTGLTFEDVILGQ